MAAPDWHWRAAADERAPRAVVAHGAAVPRLLARVKAAAADVRAQWSATAAPGLLVVFGPAETLPWADGARYAAPHPDAPALWLPTHAEPSLAVDLLWRALERRFARSPLLLWPEPSLAIPLDRQLPADDGLLAGFATRWKDSAR